MSGAETRSVGAMVFKRLNRDGRGPHRDDLLTGHAYYGDRQIDALAFGCAAGSQEHSEKPDAEKFIVFHKALLPEVIPDTCDEIIRQGRRLFGNEMCPTILLITVLVLLFAEGPRLSVARDLELRSRDAKIQEVLLGGTRSLFAQDEVVCHGASFIAMAFDQHDLTPIGTKPSSIGVQKRHGVLADLKPVVI